MCTGGLLVAGYLKHKPTIEPNTQGSGDTEDICILVMYLYNFYFLKFIFNYHIKTIKKFKQKNSIF